LLCEEESKRGRNE